MTAATRCERCLFLVRWCLCAELPHVATRTEVVIVRHYREIARSSNTGRLAHLALPSSRIVDYQVPGAAPISVDGQGAALLFPGGEPLRAGDELSRLIVLDGTWQQARRMRKKVPGLERARLVSLPPVPTDTPRMRASPGQGKVSTLEAIAYALGVLEGPAAAAPLLELFDAAVRRSIAAGRQGITLRAEAAWDDGDDAATQ